MTDTRDHNIERLVTEHARRSFGPGFADRVMRRVQEESAPFEVLLVAQFRWLAAAAMLAAMALGAYSVLGPERYESQSTLEAALGLEPVSLETVYSFGETLYGTSSSDAGGAS